MRKVQLEKLTLNVGCGGDLEKIERAKKMLEMLTGQKPVVTLSKKRSTFGVAKGKPVGVKVTLRKKKAEELLKKILAAKDNKVKLSQFDPEGNFSVGVGEYIELPGVKYSPEIGILGFDATATFKRAGYRIKYRKRAKRKIPNKHRIKREEVVEWLRQNFGVGVE